VIYKVRIKEEMDGMYQRKTAKLFLK